MIGMFTAKENERRLAAVEDRIEKAARPDPEDLVMAAELRAWFADLWRTEGGGAA